MKKIKVIYIAGYGHSGSTLLNLILGTSKKVFSLGEALNLKASLEKDKKSGKIRTCTCGRIFTECPFWSKVLKRLDLKKFFNLYASKKEAAITIFNIFFYRNGTNPYNDKHYYNLLFEGARNIKKKTMYLVDSSKDVRRLYYLLHTGNLDLKIIFLVRDGRGVINSLNKRGEHSILVFIKWTVRNLLIRKLLRRIPEKEKLCLSYDLFAQDPVKYIRKINKKFNLDIDEKNYLEKVNREVFHNFSGNTMRNRKIESIKYDQSWRRRMPKWKQVVLSILCYIPNKMWVYNENN